MRADDARLVAVLVSRGAKYAVVPSADEWKERTGRVAQDFAERYPEAVRKFRLITGPE
jgi:hypothetical protein